MREEDQEILEEALRNSGGGEDFDEMLLRATKKHLPRKYHRQFSVMLEEILKEADELGVSNRSAAQSLARKLGPSPFVPGRPAPVPPVPVAQPAPERKPDPAVDILSRHLHQAPAPANNETANLRVAPIAPLPEKEEKKEPDGDRPVAEAPAQEEAGAEPSGGSVEKLPEEQKILDLGGTSPDSLPPELKDKLRKLVKAQKRRQAWEEGAPEEEPAPGLFFKGQQRAPPFVPLSRPVNKEEDKTAPAGKKPEGEDEEDLEEPAENDAKAGK
jgi:hypothetical protein